MTPSPMHTIHLSSYVALPLDDVLDAFAGWSNIDALLTDATRRAIGEDGPDVPVRATEPVRVSDGHARVNVSWTVPTPRGRLVEGSAVVTLLRVQSGRDPLTEVLMTVDVAEVAVAQVASVLRRVLEEVTDRLAAGSRSSADA